MKALLKNNLKQFLLMVLLGIIICSFTSAILTTLVNSRIQDILFVMGLLVTMFSVFSMLEGRPIDYAIEGKAQSNSKYVLSQYVKVDKMDEEKLLSSVFISDSIKSVKSTLLSTEFLTIGIIILGASFLL